MKFRFPLDDLQKMPQLRYFMLQTTKIKDSMFQDSNFSKLVLPELEYLRFTGGLLTQIPKFPEAPKLHDVRFAYHPLEFITPFAFDHLPSLESLDLAGNGINDTLNILRSDALSFKAKNFTKLGEHTLSMNF